jgi:CRP/FNR family transcriptional regulator, cyclic AMP receptor protein
VDDDTAPAPEFGAELTEPERADLTRRGRLGRVCAGTPLFLEGTRSDVVKIVLSGRVKVFTCAEDGTEVVLAVCGPGALLGEFSAIDRQPHSASITAVEYAEILTVGQREFTAFLQAHPRTLWPLLRLIVARVRDADRTRSEFGVYDTLHRVARRVVKLVDRFGEPTDAGIRITLPLTQDELASWAGASREAVQKALRTLRDRGYLRTQRREITVVDIEGLRRLAR